MVIYGWETVQERPNPVSKKMLKEGWEHHTNLAVGSEFLQKYEGKDEFKIVQESFTRKGKPQAGIAVYKKIKKLEEIE